MFDADVGTFTVDFGIPPLGCTDPATAPDQVTCFSQASDDLDVLGPGAIITSTTNDGLAGTDSGTSYAAPAAAGVAALLRSAFPDITPDQIEDVLKQTGVPVVDDRDPNNIRTFPRVDAGRAILDDDDLDGCVNGREFLTDPAQGGQRDPFYVWDFYDVDGDRSITLFGDVFPVAFEFGTAGSNLTDRSAPPPGADVWDMGPPDGLVTLLDDIFGVAFQFGHSCQGPP